MMVVNIEAIPATGSPWQMGFQLLHYALGYRTWTPVTINRFLLPPLDSLRIGVLD